MLKARQLLLWSLILIVLPPSLSLAGIKPSVSKLKITGQEASLHVQAWQVPLTSLMEYLARASGISLHYANLPVRQLITADCEGAVLNGLLGCLLGSAVNMVARYNELGNAEEVWLLDGNMADQNLVGNAFAATDGWDVAAEGEDLLEQAQSKDPLQRSQAISNMAVAEIKDPVLAKKILSEALNDENPEIRAKAIGSLSRVDAANARPQLLQMLGDKDVGVRLSTVVAGYNDPAVLQQAQNDSDEKVRMFAEISLGKLNNSKP